jgi:hypothetical protein
MSASLNFLLAAANFEACVLTYEDPAEVCDAKLSAADAYVESVNQAKGVTVSGLPPKFLAPMKLRLAAYRRALDLYDFVAFTSPGSNVGVGGKGGFCEGTRVEYARRDAATVRANLRALHLHDDRF